MGMENLNIGDKVSITTFAGHVYTNRGTGTIVAEEDARCWSGRVKTGRFLVKVDKPEDFPCAKLCDGVLAFVTSELEKINA